MRYGTYKWIKVKDMNTEQTIEDRLWEYIDGISSERSAIENLLATNREWQHKYQELLNVHQLLNDSELDAPSMRFTKNVMEEIARHHVAPAARTYINKNIIRSIGAFFLTLIVGFIVWIFAHVSWGAGDNNTSSLLNTKPDLGLDKPLSNINNLDYSKAINGTWLSLFMLISVIMGFVLLDMYLQRKKRSTT